MLEKKPVDPRFQKLFTPGYIGKTWVKNRIVREPMLSCLATPDGCITERDIDHYKEFAKGGTGLIIVEFTWVDDDASKSAMGQPGVTNAEHQPGLMWLANAIKGCGARACIQIVHCGRQRFLGTRPYKSAHRTGWPDLYCPRGTQDRGAGVPEELSIEEIEDLIEDFGDAALRCKDVGFDMVEVHAAHGYLITNFLSPHNRRPDWYGGSLTNRMRFLLQVFENMRQKVGPDYTLGARLSGTDYDAENPITVEETIQVAKELEKLGASFIDVSGGYHQFGHCETVTMYQPLAFQAWAAEKIRKALNIPVIVTGSITSPELAEKLLQEGKGDYVGLGRPLVADPHFARKAQEGRPEDIRPCIRCVECTDRGVSRGYLTCAVNATTGREGELTKISPAARKKKVAVIGGGPGGMEATRVAALRGHEVTLFERRELGGLLIEASLPEFKSDIKPLIKYHITQLEKTGVKVVREEATSQTIKDGKFEVAVVATGAVESAFPTIPGMKKTSAVSALDVIRGAKTGDNVLIIGGGIVGSETALLLGKQGKKVTITTRQSKIGQGLSMEMKRAYFHLIADLPITAITEVRLEEVTDDGAVVGTFYGERTAIKADTIVIAGGFKPNLKLWDELSQLSQLEVYAIGDCVEPRSAFDAIHEGFHTAFELM